jgi:two-component sensor histidine kinase
MKDALVQEKQVLLQELQHRVANSLQIIASVLMQSARRVQSEETRTPGPCLAFRDSGR